MTWRQSKELSDAGIGDDEEIVLIQKTLKVITRSQSEVG